LYWDTPQPVVGPVEVTGSVSTNNVDAPDGFPDTTGVPGRSHGIPQYVLILDAHAMDDFPQEDMPAIDRAAHPVSQEAIDAACGYAAAARKIRWRGLWPPMGPSPKALRQPSPDSQ